MAAEAHVLHSILLAWGAHPRVRLARMNTGAALIKGRLVKFGVPGTPDICGMLAPDGRFVGIECKSSTGKQRRAQQAFQRVTERMGGVYVLARSVADVDAVLIPIVGPR
jgi:hypothetical protein